MKVTRGFCTNDAQPTTSPLLEKPGFYFALHGGDIIEPSPITASGQASKWFEPPYPDSIVRRTVTANCLPFISWNFGGHQGYAGFKPYGFDSPAYKEWPCIKGTPLEAEVVPGALAMCITIRNGLTVLLPALFLGCVVMAVMLFAR